MIQIDTRQQLSRRIAARFMERRLPWPNHVDLMLTEDCNHRCDYCFVKEKRKHRHMPQETVTSSVDFMFRRAKQGGKVRFLLFGGEPLVNWDGLVRTVEYAEKRGRETGVEPTFSMTTNGTLLNRARLTFLRQHGIKYLLSIDGDRETHDAHRRMMDGGSSYDAVMGKFPLLRAFQRWQGTRMTVQPGFVSRVYENVVHLYERGINQFFVGPATGVRWSSGDLEEYERQMLDVVEFYVALQKKNAPFRLTLFEQSLESEEGALRNIWGCGAGRTRVCIAADGSLYGCAKIYGVTEDKEAIKLGDIWSGYSLPENRRDLLDKSVKRREPCQTCDLASECKGGCPATNFEENGSYLIPCALDCAVQRINVRVKQRVRELNGRHDSPTE